MLGVIVNMFVISHAACEGVVEGSKQMQLPGQTRNWSLEVL